MRPFGRVFVLVPFCIFPLSTLFNQNTLLAQCLQLYIYRHCKRLLTIIYL